MPAPDYTAEYAACRGRIRTMLSGIASADESTVVPTCPDWTVRDLCAHIAGVASALVNRDNPTPDGGQAWVDGHVAARRHLPVVALLDEWDDVGPAFEGIMRKVPRAFAGLLYDVIAHEHDLAHALGRQGDRDGDGVVGALELSIDLLRRDLAARGPVPGSMRLRASGQEWLVGEGDPVLAIETSAFDLLRLLGSRRSEAQILAAPWSGDPRPFLSAIAHMPLPLADVVE